MVVYLIRKPYRSASDAVWRSFLEEMKRLPQDDLNVRGAVEAAQDELDVRSGKATRAEILERSRARLKASFQRLREVQAAEKKEMQEKQRQQEKK